MFRPLTARILALSALISTYAAAQSTLNPDISVIPRFRLESNDGEQLPDRRQFARPEFSLEEFELALQAYLNPYARADVFLAKAGTGEEPVEIEEAYATFIRGLPLDLNIRIGKYLAEFGKLNTLHPHAWPFVSKPLSLERFLGDDGLNDLGLSASLLIPTGNVVYTKLTVDVLRGHAIGVLNPGTAASGGGPGMVDTTGGRPIYANSARLMIFFPVGDNSDFEIGFSGLTGIHDPYRKYRFFYGNVDFKYKWKPSAYTSFTLQGEGLFNSRIVEAGVDRSGRLLSKRVTSAGMYAYVDWQFAKIFSLGARYDWSQSPYGKEDEADGFAVFLGFYPVEETAAFRLQYERIRTNTPAAATVSINTVALQFIFSLGPHKAHPF